MFGLSSYPFQHVGSLKWPSGAAAAAAAGFAGHASSCLFGLPPLLLASLSFWMGAESDGPTFRYPSTTIPTLFYRFQTPRRFIIILAESVPLSTI